MPQGPGLLGWMWGLRGAAATSAWTSCRRQWGDSGGSGWQDKEEPNINSADVVSHAVEIPKHGSVEATVPCNK